MTIGEGGDSDEERGDKVMVVGRGVMVMGGGGDKVIRGGYR